ncbi:hypothetical protein [Treponema bryantii]|uniref:hypothetical protein n=1 Tax=Treponema bryantii TaxID=163 RepID=UPI0003B74AA0|nr:hypothetical protein [Treponema bryantii]
MKKLSLLFITVFLFSVTSCFFGSSYTSYDFPDNTYYYTIPQDAEKIYFSDFHDGKKCYLIYSNETNQNLYSSEDTIDFNFLNKGESRSAVSDSNIIIDKHVVKLDNGIYRDEVRFKKPEIKINNSSRSAVSGFSRNYNSLLTQNLTTGDQGQFFGITGANDSITSNTYTLKAIGSHCRIWYYHNSNLVSIPDQKFVDLAQTLDSVFVEETSIFGSNIISPQVARNEAITADSNTKLEVLVYDLFGDATSNQTSGVFGFFNPTDIFLNSALASQRYSQTSNECEVIHVDSYFLQKDLEGYTANGRNIQTYYVESTLIHEFQHLLNFCNKYGQYETWFTEMLSMCAEDVFKLDDLSAPKSRFDIYFDKPYQGFGNWPDDDNDTVLYSYANAYAFGAYLMRNYGGINLINKIATNNYTNEGAITKALQDLGYNETFYTVFEKFGSVYACTDSSGLSLNKSITSSVNGISKTLEAINLTDYAFHEYSSLYALKSDVNNKLYYDINNLGWFETSDKTKFYLRGPRIFNNEYEFSEAIQPYGFIVHYVGRVSSGDYVIIDRESELNVTLVLKD